MNDTRCTKCNKRLGKLTAPWQIKCPRCGEMNEQKEEPQDGQGTVE